MTRINAIKNTYTSNLYNRRKELQNAQKKIFIDKDIKPEAKAILEHAKSEIAKYTQTSKNSKMELYFKNYPSKAFDSIIRIETKISNPQNKAIIENTEIVYEGENKQTFLKKIFKNIENMKNNSYKRI